MEALKVGATNSYRCPNLSLLTTPSVCIKIVLEHTVVLYPRERCLNSIVLCKVLCCYKNVENKNKQLLHPLVPDLSYTAQRELRVLSSEVSTLIVEVLVNRALMVVSETV